MTTTRDTLIDLENRFWRSMVDEDTDSALDMLNDPALLVSSHGTMKFDHDGYRRMAQQGTMVLTSYQLSDIDVTFANDDTAILTYRVRQELAPRGRSSGITQEMADTSTWVRKGGQWQCVMHTETPLDEPPAPLEAPKTN